MFPSKKSPERLGRPGQGTEGVHTEVGNRTPNAIVFDLVTRFCLLAHICLEQRWCLGRTLADEGAEILR